MKDKIIIGSDEGSYTVTNSGRTITLTGLYFVPKQEQLAYVFNKTQDKLYYAPAEGIALATLAGGVITIDSTFPILISGDILHIQMWSPNRGFDPNLDSSKVITQNPEYAHTTSVEALVGETNLANARATADTGGTATSLVDATGAFSVANIAVGYEVYATTGSTHATVLSVDSGTAITTTTGVTDWSSAAYSLPIVKRYEINMDTYKNVTIHYRLTTGANETAYLKVYGTLDDTATVDADTNWVDQSTAILGLSGITVTPTTTVESIKFVTNVTMLKYMVKLVMENAVSTLANNLFKVFIKKG